VFDKPMPPARKVLAYSIAACALLLLLGTLSPWAWASGVPGGQMPQPMIGSMFPRTGFFRSLGWLLSLPALGLAVLNLSGAGRNGWLALLLLPLFVASATLGSVSWQYLDQFTHEPHIYGPPVPADISIAWGVKLMTISAVGGATLSALLFVLTLRRTEPA
jgi:uncharacterized membrane protein YhaH (DUF805 family)